MTAAATESRRPPPRLRVGRSEPHGGGRTHRRPPTATPEAWPDIVHPDVSSDPAPERERDAALLERIVQGDATAFRELTNLHLTMIVTYSTRILGSAADAEDVAQETFLRAWQHAKRYEPRARARTWLLAIAHNLALDRLRRRKARREEPSDDQALDIAPGSEEPARLLLRKTAALEVSRALDSLPERQKTALLLCHEQGLTGAEIAEVMDTSPDAVESLLARGRRTLRTLLAPEDSSSDR